MNHESITKSQIILSVILCITSITLSVSISAMESLLGILLVILVIYFYKKDIDITNNCPYFIPFFIYWITTLLPFFFGSEDAFNKGNMASLWPMLYLFVGYYFISRKNIRFIFIALAIGTIALGLSVIRDGLIFHAQRSNGFIGYMPAGEILSLGAVIAFGIIATGYEKNIFLRIFYILTCVIAFIGIMYTETREALLSFFIAICFIFIIKYKRKGLALSLLILIIICGICYFTPLNKRFVEIFKDFGNMNTSHGWRLVLWKNTITLFKQYPIFGIGKGTYESLIRPLLPPINLPTSHAHNGYLAQLVLFGIVGFIAFCYFYGKIIYGFVSQKITKNNLALIGLALIIAYAIQGLTENNFQDGKLMMFSSFVFGILLGALKNKIPDKIR